MSFIHHLRMRGEGKEKPAPPWHLHDKLKCYEFCRSIGIPTVKVLREFEHPQDIDFQGLPDKFVLKPTYHSSSIGVMVLSRTETGYYDAMTRKEMTAHEIVRKQTEIHDGHSRNAGKCTIVEEKITDASGGRIPRDYKAYSFHGEIAFILEMDRNAGRPHISWFDGDFRPLADDRIWTNEKYLTLREAVRPAGWRELIDLAKRASAAIPAPFASIDMYSAERGPLLGEVTLVPGGFYFGKLFVPSKEQDAAMGRLWEDAARRLAREGKAPRLHLSARG